MTEIRLIKKQSLSSLVEKLRQSGQRVIAPLPTGTAGKSWFRYLDCDEHIDLEQVAANSPKFGVFPLVEEVLKFKKNGNQVAIEDEKIQLQPTVIFGLRPCDARGLKVLENVFLDGHQDVFVRERRAAMTLITLSCSAADPDCFCTSVGGGPGDSEGSDLLLTPVGDGRFLVEVLSPKGNRVLDLAAEFFEPAERLDKGPFLASVPVRFRLSEVQAKLPGLFNDEEFWRAQSLACLGCSTCAFVCPTCSCFDIQDEADLKSGSRLRSWDSCGQRLFTLHASGHNPRNVQSQRWRQRVMHKFSYLPERTFEAGHETDSTAVPRASGLLGCVGCGRCSRSCPVDMNLIERLTAIAEAEI